MRYKGRPKQVSNPDGSKDGWTKTGDGAVALGEPQQTPSWIPVNDHPTDKATWHFRFVTPRDLIAISNGELVSKERTDDSTITEWEQSEPMASYLALAAIGEFRVDRGRGRRGFPTWAPSTGASQVRRRRDPRAHGDRP